MCSFYVRDLIDGEWEYHTFPECNKNSKEDFIIYFHTLLISDEMDRNEFEEKDEYFYQLKYTDGTSIIIDTYKVNKITTHLLFSSIPVEQIPNMQFKKKWNARSINKEYKLLSFLGD